MSDEFHEESASSGGAGRDSGESSGSERGGLSTDAKSEKSDSGAQSEAPSAQKDTGGRGPNGDDRPSLDRSQGGQPETRAYSDTEHSGQANDYQSRVEQLQRDGMSHVDAVHQATQESTGHGDLSKSSPEANGKSGSSAKSDTGAKAQNGNDRPDLNGRAADKSDTSGHGAVASGSNDSQRPSLNGKGPDNSKTDPTKAEAKDPGAKSEATKSEATKSEPSFFSKAVDLAKGYIGAAAEAGKQELSRQFDPAGVTEGIARAEAAVLGGKGLGAAADEFKKSVESSPAAQALQTGKDLGAGIKQDLTAQNRTAGEKLENAANRVNMAANPAVGGVKAFESAKAAGAQGDYKQVGADVHSMQQSATDTVVTAVGAVAGGPESRAEPSTAAARVRSEAPQSDLHTSASEPAAKSEPGAKGEAKTEAKGEAKAEARGEPAKGEAKAEARGEAEESRGAKGEADKAAEKADPKAKGEARSELDLEQATGMPLENQRAVIETCKTHDVLIDMRPTNPEAPRLLAEGNLPKPEAIKAKTIEALDTYIGFRQEDMGLVGYKEPTPPVVGEYPPELKAEVDDRYERRAEEYRDLASDMKNLSLPPGSRDRFAAVDFDKQVMVDNNGIVRVVDGNGQPGVGFTGDHDIFEIRNSDGTPVSAEKYNQVVTTLVQKGVGVEHGAHMHWDVPPKPTNTELFKDQTKMFQGIADKHMPEAKDGKDLYRFAPDGSIIAIRADPNTTSINAARAAGKADKAGAVEDIDATVDAIGH